MHMQLRVPIPGVVLQELRHHELVRIDPPTRATPVMPDPGVPRLLLQVVHRRPGTGQHGVLDRLRERLPRLRGLLESPAARASFAVRSNATATTLRSSGARTSRQ